MIKLCEIKVIFTILNHWSIFLSYKFTYLPYKAWFYKYFLEFILEGTQNSNHHVNAHKNEKLRNVLFLEKII